MYQPREGLSTQKTKKFLKPTQVIGLRYRKPISQTEWRDNANSTITFDDLMFAMCLTYLTFSSPTKNKLRAESSDNLAFAQGIYVLGKSNRVQSLINGFQHLKLRNPRRLRVMQLYRIGNFSNDLHRLESNFSGEISVRWIPTWLA